MKNLLSLFTIGAVTLVMLGAVSLTPKALADRPEAKIKICHSTDSHTNPYTSPEVDPDAMDGDAGNDNGQGDHYMEHNGPVWHEGIADHSWGDIVPPLEGKHQGKNWDEDGQKIYNNGCNIAMVVDPTPTLDPTPTATPSAEPTATPTPEQHNDNGGGSSSGSSSPSEPKKEEGQVLGASTYAGTGVVEDIATNVFGILGAVSFASGLVLAKKTK